MRSNIITEGRSCSTCGCQHVTINHKAGGDMETSHMLVNDEKANVGFELKNPATTSVYDMKNPQLSVGHTRCDGQGIRTSLSLMCQTSQGRWEYLMVREGEIMLIDGQCVIVKRKTS